MVIFHSYCMLNYQGVTGWRLRTWLFIFHIGNHYPNWLTFFRRVETINRINHRDWSGDFKARLQHPSTNSGRVISSSSKRWGMTRTEGTSNKLGRWCVSACFKRVFCWHPDHRHQLAEVILVILYFEENLTASGCFMICRQTKISVANAAWKLCVFWLSE